MSSACKNISIKSDINIFAGDELAGNFNIYKELKSGENKSFGRMKFKIVFAILIAKLTESFRLSPSSDGCSPNVYRVLDDSR